MFNFIVYNQKNSLVLPHLKRRCLLGFWDTRKFIQKNFLHRKCITFSCDPKLKQVNLKKPHTKVYGFNLWT